AFLFLAGACAIGAIVAATFVRGGGGKTELELEEIASPLRDPHMWLLGLGTGLFLVAQIGIISFVVLFLHDARHVQRGWIVLAAFLFAAAAPSLGVLVLSRLSERARRPGTSETQRATLRTPD